MKFQMNNIKMRFYRNLGPIRFEGETNSIQIFSSQPSTSIFQPKQSINLPILFEQVALFYNNYLHKDCFRVYEEDNKLQCIVINQCKKIDFKNIDSQNVCTMLLQAAKTVSKMSAVVYNRIGDFSHFQFRMIGDRRVFVYIPIHIQEDQSTRENKQVQGLMELANILKIENNKSQELLLKKLKRCKKVSDIIEEIHYFSNIYGETKKIEKPFKTEKQQLNKRLINKPNKSIRKLNLFKLDNSKSKIKFYSHHESYSEPRKSSTAIHISIPQPKIQANSLYSSATRSVFSNCKRNQVLKNNFLEASCRSCKIKDIKIKEVTFQKQKILKKIAIKLQEATVNSINILDEQKLLSKLRNNRKQDQEPKLEEIQFTKSVAINQQQIQKQKTVQKSLVVQNKEQLLKNQSKIQIQHPVQSQQSQKITQNKQPKLISQPSKLSFNDFKDIPIPKHESNQHKQLSNQQNVASSKTTQESQKKLKKKKKVPLKEYQIQSSEIQIVDLNIKPMEAITPKQNHRLQSKKDIKIGNDYAQTRKNSWIDKNEISGFQETKRIPKKQVSSITQKLSKRQKTIDIMGTAVANTTLHLQKYEKIFWELPMFFIYRAFYFFRVQLQQQFEKIKQQNRNYIDLKNENAKIKESVSKLIKIIHKKLKKEDADLLQNIKHFLTLQPINCEIIMKTFVKEYIDSLTDATNGSYPQLSAHLLEIVDAYLVYVGVPMDFTEREKAEQNKEDRNTYLKKQMKVLRKYL